MKANVRENVSSISRLLFERVSKSFKQHAIIKFTGNTGLGKSYAMMGVLEKTSILIAEKFGGSPDDYFNIDNVAIITQEEVRRVAGRFKKHGLYCLDDIGVGANARRAMSDDNILLNDIVSTFRPNENVLGLTVPKNRMIDVVQRELAHYNIEMGDPFFERGYSTGTLYIPQETQYGMTNTYPIWNNKIYKSHVFSLPSKKLIEEYDERRNIISKELEVDNVSMYGLKTETKKMKVILDAQKAGICVESPTVNRAKRIRHKTLEVANIELNNIPSNGNKNENNISKLKIVDSTFNDESINNNNEEYLNENYIIENNPNKRNDLNDLSEIMRSKRKRTYS